MRAKDESAEVLTWEHRDTERLAFALRSGNEVLGELSWDKGEGSLANARAGDEQWTFKRLGFLQPHVTIRKAGSDKNIARFDAQWNGPGHLHASNGRTYRWESNFWRAEWSWVNAEGVHIVTFKRNFGDVKRDGTAHLDPAGKTDPQASMLLILGWYLIILMSEDTAAQIH